MAERVAINASPLIFLSRGGYLDLLRYFADQVVVSTPVAQEIRAKGSNDISANEVTFLQLGRL